MRFSANVGESVNSVSDTFQNKIPQMVFQLFGGIQICFFSQRPDKLPRLTHYRNNSETSGNPECDGGNLAEPGGTMWNHVEPCGGYHNTTGRDSLISTSF